MTIFTIGARVGVRGNVKAKTIFGTVIDTSPTYGICVEFDSGGGAWFTPSIIYLEERATRKEVAT